MVSRQDGGGSISPLCSASDGCDPRDEFLSSSPTDHRISFRLTLSLFSLHKHSQLTANG